MPGESYPQASPSPDPAPPPASRSWPASAPSTPSSPPGPQPGLTSYQTPRVPDLWMPGTRVEDDAPVSLGAGASPYPAGFLTDLLRPQSSFCRAVSRAAESVTNRTQAGTRGK